MSGRSREAEARAAALPESGAQRAPKVTGSPQPGAAHPGPTCCRPQCNLHFKSSSPLSPGFGKCGLNGATSRSKLPILEHSCRQAPRGERFDENGGCLHPLSAPFLGCAGNKTPIIHWMASNSRWDRPALQLTPPDPSPSATGFPTPRRFSRWRPKARSRRVGCSAAKT